MTSAVVSSISFLKSFQVPLRFETNSTALQHFFILTVRFHMAYEEFLAYRSRLFSSLQRKLYEA